MSSISQTYSASFFQVTASNFSGVAPVSRPRCRVVDDRVPWRKGRGFAFGTSNRKAFVYKELLTCQISHSTERLVVLLNNVLTLSSAKPVPAYGTEVICQL